MPAHLAALRLQPRPPVRLELEDRVENLQRTLAHQNHVCRPRARPRESAVALELVGADVRVELVLAQYVVILRMNHEVGPALEGEQRMIRRAAVRASRQACPVGDSVQRALAELGMDVEQVGPVEGEAVFGTDGLPEQKDVGRSAHVCALVG